MSIESLIIIIVSFALLLVLSDFFMLRKLRNDVSNMMSLLIGDESHNDPVDIVAGEPQEENYSDESEEEEETVKEELKVEINREVEKITEEMRHQEFIREKLEKHYVTLRKVARDMIDSLISPPPYTSPNDTYIPVPVINERPLWVDLAKNHIPSEKGDLLNRWADFVDTMNKITVMKTRVFRNVENYLFGGLNFTRKDSIKSEPQENVYSIDALLKLMNSIFFNEKLKIEVTDGKRGKKLAKSVLLSLGDSNLVSGSNDEISSIEAKINSLLNSEEQYTVEGMNELVELLKNAEKTKSEITDTLNWFIFDNSEMKMCEMVKSD
ncbi:hypothetical protein ACNF40_03435 [Cuniculiplasma sp. SKW4]|uniref:hypothetical protein n=1 Tax=Cuniculiplasma sp. SKW4 TaxID=3400171 RepID=UPI003FD4F288